jgi:hypothetical protein
VMRADCVAMTTAVAAAASVPSSFTSTNAWRTTPRKEKRAIEGR